MGLIDTPVGSLAAVVIGGLLIKAGRASLRDSVRFYEHLLGIDPIKTFTFDLLLAALKRPQANPVVFSIMILLVGWSLFFLGVLNLIDFARQ
jgi:hypothetical protein